MTFKTGVVQAVDPASGRVRVAFPGDDGMVSGWLHVTSASTRNNKSFAMPDLGEHVACTLDDRGESGAVIGAIYSTAEPPPVTSGDKVHLAFADGTWLEYDRAAHRLTAHVEGEVAIAATKTVTIEAKGAITLRSTEAVVLDAPALTISAGGGAAAASLTGNFTLDGSLSATGAVMDGGGNSNHHSH